MLELHHNYPSAAIVIAANNFAITSNSSLIFKNEKGEIISLVICYECGSCYNAFANVDLDKLKQIKERKIEKE